MQSNSRILSPTPSAIVKVTLSGGLFITFFSPEYEKGCAIELSPKDLTLGIFKKLILDVESYLGLLAQKCDVKMVGPAKLIQSAQGLLSEIKITPKSCAERELAGIEVIFHPDSGRLQAELLPSTSEIKVKQKTKVMIIDDSATIRKLLSTIFSRDPEIEVVAMAELPSQAEELIKKFRPDVITLDIHMPEMDGVTLLKRFFPKYPTPVILITSLSMEEGPLVLEALENGAIDYIQKPSFEVLDQMAPLILEKIKVAAKARIAQKRPSAAAARRLTLANTDQQILIAIGSSTGGTEALKEILVRLPESIPPIVIVQHIPPIFSMAFAKRMDELCPFHVKEAADGDEVVPNRVLIAPGGKQMHLAFRGGLLRAVITDSPPVNRHKPSVDVLFDSVAELIGKKAIGVILTGMGADGAKGLLKMRAAGAHTVAQDEASSVVFGMPREAIKLGAAEKITSLLAIPELLVSWLT